MVNAEAYSVLWSMQRLTAFYCESRSLQCFIVKVEVCSMSEFTEAETKKFKKGTVILREGEFEMCMFDIRYGRVGVYKNYGCDNQTEVAILEEGDFFGEMGLIEARPRSATVVALEDTITDIITQENFGLYFKERPAKVLSIMQHMSSRIRDLTTDYIDACQCISEYLEAEEANAPKSAGLISRMKRFRL